MYDMIYNLLLGCTLEKFKIILSITPNLDLHADNEKIFKIACKRGYFDIVQYLLTNNFNIDVHADNDYAFKWACYKNHIEIVKYLLNNYDVKEIDIGFIWACKGCNYNVVKYLLYNNLNIHVNIHAENDEAFKWACFSNNESIIRLILKHTNVITNEMIKIFYFYNCYYYNEFEKLIKNQKCLIELKNNKIVSYKILFSIFNTLNLCNSIYLGII